VLTVMYIASTLCLQERCARCSDPIFAVSRVTWFSRCYGSVQTDRRQCMWAYNVVLWAADGNKCYWLKRTNLTLTAWEGTVVSKFARSKPLSWSHHTDVYFAMFKYCIT